MEGRVDGRVDGRTDRWMDGQMDGWTDGRINGRMVIKVLGVIEIYKADILTFFSREATQ